MSLDGTLPRPWFGGWLDKRRRARRAAKGAEGQAGGDDAVSDARFGGGGDRESDWVTVHRAPEMLEAQIVRGALNAAGLPVLLRNHVSSALPGATIGAFVDVQVPRTLEDRALAVLAGNGSGDEREDGEWSEEDAAADDEAGVAE